MLDSFDARQNIFGGTQYLRILLDQFGGDVTLALAAYNAGENAVLRYGGVPPYKETRGYVQRVQTLLRGALRRACRRPARPPSTRRAHGARHSAPRREPRRTARRARAHASSRRGPASTTAGATSAA